MLASVLASVLADAGPELVLRLLGRPLHLGPHAHGLLGEA